MSDIKMPIGAQEMSEYLMADAIAVNVLNNRDELERADVRNEIRAAMRFIRIGAIAWLLQNGVSVPVELLCDQAHPQVGSQLPDYRK